MNDDNKLSLLDALAVVRAAGYYAIPREKVVTFTGKKNYDDRSIISQFENLDFFRYILRDTYRAIVDELLRCDGAAQVRAERPAHLPGCTQLTTTIQLIPYTEAEDPVLAGIRKAMTSR